MYWHLMKIKSSWIHRNWDIYRNKLLPLTQIFQVNIPLSSELFTELARVNVFGRVIQLKRSITILFMVYSIILLQIYLRMYGDKCFDVFFLPLLRWHAKRLLNSSHNFLPIRKYLIKFLDSNDIWKNIVLYSLIT